MDYNIREKIPKNCPGWTDDSPLPCKICKIPCFAHEMI